jgi:DNA-binding NarL/FixJ family response regulator
MSSLGNEWSKLLSAREREIALLVGCGLSNKEVARKLGLSPGTVKTHVHSIFVKLGERNRGRMVILTQSFAPPKKARSDTSPFGDDLRVGNF